MELMYAMAALGAQYVPEYEQLANTYFFQAVERLQVTKTVALPSLATTMPLHTLTDGQSRLRLVQTRVLLVEYAAWKTSKQMGQWAIKEREATKDVRRMILTIPFAY